MEDFRQVGAIVSWFRVSKRVSKHSQYSCQLVSIFFNPLFLLIYVRLDFSCCSRTRGWCCSSSWERCLTTLLTDVSEYKSCQWEGADLRVTLPVISYSPTDRHSFCELLFPNFVQCAVLPVLCYVPFSSNNQNIYNLLLKLDKRLVKPLRYILQSTLDVIKQRILKYTLRYWWNQYNVVSLPC